MPLIVDGGRKIERSLIRAGAASIEDATGERLDYADAILLDFNAIF